MVTILTIDSEYESATRLGYKTVLDLTPRTKDLVIRWGNSESFGKKDFEKVVNPAKSISLNCHKLNALRKMAKVVKTPEVYTKRAGRRRLVLLRPIAHANGCDFRVVQGPVDIPYDWYGTEWIKTKLEYRVWFAWDKTICAERIQVEKVDGQLVESDKRSDKYPCRSSWGYKFIDKTPRKLHKDVLKAAKKIGLNVGAADVLVKNEEFIFLELNSAPTVDDSEIREFYKNAIEEYVRSNQ